MSADLHIHVYEGLEESDLRNFFCNTMGHKYFNLSTAALKQKYESGSYAKIEATPNIWIGEVSWLKAGLTGDIRTHVPEAVERISNLVGQDLPELTPALIGSILQALAIPNTSNYRLTKWEPVEEFLRKHAGKKVFTVSW